MDVPERVGLNLGVLGESLSIRSIAVRPSDGVRIPDDRFLHSGVLNMMRRSLVCGLLLLAPSVSVLGDDKHDHSTSAATNAGLEKMKTLIGTWVAADSDGKPTDQVVSVIKLTAGGSAIHETLFPGQPQEMISVYTADGNDLVMTHYCMLGNQPRLKASPDAKANEIKFEFAGGSNLDPKKDKHMHASTLKIVDADHFEIHGIAWENGAPATEMCGEMKLIRKQLGTDVAERSR
jgi:hypothetical protein